MSQEALGVCLAVPHEELHQATQKLGPAFVEAYKEAQYPSNSAATIFYFSIKPDASVKCSSFPTSAPKLWAAHAIH